MATSPLFAPTLDVLRQELRLSGLADATDGQSVFNAAILATRVDLYRLLGKARVDEIAAFAESESPSTENEILRATARVTEQHLARWHLMGSMPMLFMDGGGKGQEEWATEGAFRDISQSSIEDKRRILWQQIQENIEVLQGEELGEETTIKAATLEPETDTVVCPGQSLGGLVLE